MNNIQYIFEMCCYILVSVRNSKAYFILEIKWSVWPCANTHTSHPSSLDNNTELSRATTPTTPSSVLSIRSCCCCCCCSLLFLRHSHCRLLWELAGGYRLVNSQNNSYYMYELSLRISLNFTVLPRKSIFLGFILNAGNPLTSVQEILMLDQ